LPWVNQRLSPFNDCGNPRGVFFRVILPCWHTGTFVDSKTIYFVYAHNVINGYSRVFKEPNYFRCWAPSAKAFDDRGSSIILHTWFQHLGYFENMTTRSIRLSRTPTTSGHNIAKNLNLNLFGFWWRILYIIVQHLYIQTAVSLHI